jgi:two-component system OmpR family response regulator
LGESKELFECVLNEVHYSYGLLNLTKSQRFILKMKIQKILLVDDDPNIQMIAQMGLEDRPEWQVSLASSGMEALQKFAQEKPDLVILDMMMPGMDGVTTLSKIKEQSKNADIPVIFMTAKVQKHEIEKYLATGVAGVITKPFDPMTLAQDIIKIVGHD